METESPQHTCHRNILAEQRDGFAQLLIGVAHGRGPRRWGRIGPGEGTLRRCRRRVRPHLVLERAIAIRRVEAVGVEPQRCGQCAELRGGEGAQRHERGVGVEPGAYRTHLGDAPGEALGKQADDDRQDVMDQPDPALDPAHRSRELDRVGAQRIARRAQARGLLGVRHHLFDLIEGARKPCGQAIGQQAEGGVAFGAVPASDSCPARGLARVGAVAGERTSPVRMIRTALEACIAPRLSPNVSLAGVPRFIPKLHRPWPGGRLPVRANSSLVRRNAETTTRAPLRQAVTMWTRPADRAPSYGPCGQGMDKCAALPLPTLGALAPTSPPLLQQRFMEKATAPAPAGSRITPSSQEIRLRNTPTNSRGVPTRECEKQQSALGQCGDA